MTITTDMKLENLKNTKKPHSLGLYIHIPFCRSRCLYCDFTSFAARGTEEIEKYLSALCREIEQRGREVREYGYEVDTVYLGGGTPSLLTPEQTERILSTVRGTFCVSPEAEITLECNPLTHLDDGEEYFTSLHTLGINRLSVGIQSAVDSELKLIGRRHTFEQARETVLCARRSGFDNISVDLMLALPSQTIATLETSVRAMIGLCPEHISIYSLQLEEGTPLCRMRERYELPSDDEAADMYELAVELLCDGGYEHYEISNFARLGRRSRHNSKYWRLDEYLGMGLAAHSDILGERRENTADMEKYLRGEWLAEVRAIDRAERELEYLMLGLRTSDGVARTELRERFSADLDEKYGERIARTVKLGLAHDDGERIRLTERGFEVSNSILCDLLNFDNISIDKNA